jgi:hypothetical protein
MVQFLRGRPTLDPGRLDASLEDFVAHPAYGVSQLRKDLEPKFARR